MGRRIIDPARAVAIVARHGPGRARPPDPPPEPAPAATADESSGTLVWSGRVRHRSLHPLLRVIRPVAILSGTLKGIYRSVLEMVWGQLLGGHRAPPVQRLLAAIVLVVSGMLFALVGSFDAWVLLAIIALWSIDRVIATDAFRRPRSAERVTLIRRGEVLTRRAIGPDGRIVMETLPVTEVAGVFVEPFDYLGGAFREPLGTLWHVGVEAVDGGGFVIDEFADAERAIAGARALGEALGTRVTVPHSMGAGPLAARSPGARTPLRDACGLVRLRRDETETRISKRLSILGAFEILGALLYDSGFLFFILLISGVLEVLGAHVNPLLVAPLADAVAPATLAYAPDTLLDELIDAYSWLHGVEFAFALLLLLRGAAVHCRSIRLDIGERAVVYRVSRRTSRCLRTAAIGDVLLLSHPTLMVLAADDKGRTLVIDDFVTGGEYRYVLLALLEQTKPG